MFVGSREGFREGVGAQTRGICANYIMRQYSRHWRQQCVCLLGKSTLPAFLLPLLQAAVMHSLAEPVACAV